MQDFFRGLVAKMWQRQVKRLVAAKPHLKIVAVGGSVGKTSTKLAIASVLKQKYKVLVHEGNFNTEIGLPLSIFDLPLPENLRNPLEWIKLYYRANKIINGEYPYQVLVLELGTDHPGEIPAFMSYLHPDIGVVTAVTPEHMEGFKTMAAVLEEEIALAEGSQFALLNANDNLLAKRRIRLRVPSSTYGVQAGDYRLDSGGFDSETLSAKPATITIGREKLKFSPEVIALHSFNALAAAAAVADLIGGFRLDEIKAGLEGFHPVSGRMNPLLGKNHSLIIDDSYNSSPDAAIAALDTLKNLEGRKVAVLGSMNELGDYAKQGHQDVGRACVDIDYLITIGADAAKYLAPAAAKSGLPAERIMTFDSPYPAGEAALKLLTPGAKVLVKGSQNRVFAEEAAKLLLASPKDTAKLVRQSPAWTARKRQQFGVQ